MAPWCPSTGSGKINGLGFFFLTDSFMPLLPRTEIMGRGMAGSSPTTKLLWPRAELGAHHQMKKATGYGHLERESPLTHRGTLISQPATVTTRFRLRHLPLLQQSITATASCG